jgi:hypothetical protein
LGGAKKRERAAKFTPRVFPGLPDTAADGSAAQKSAAARPRQNQGGTAQMRPRESLGAFLLPPHQNVSKAEKSAFKFRRKKQ